MDSPLCGGVHPCSCGVINHGGSVSSGINEVVILFGSTKKVIYAKKFSTLNLNLLLDFFFVNKIKFYNQQRKKPSIPRHTLENLYLYNKETRRVLFSFVFFFPSLPSASHSWFRPFFQIPSLPFALFVSSGIAFVRIFSMWAICVIEEAIHYWYHLAHLMSCEPFLPK